MALIRLHECAGWSAPLLFEYGINRFSHDMAHIIECIQFQNNFYATISITIWGIYLVFICFSCYILEYLFLMLYLRKPLLTVLSYWNQEKYNSSWFKREVRSVSWSVMEEGEWPMDTVASMQYIETNTSHVMRKPIFVMCEQQRCRSACTSRQSDQHFCCLPPR